ncbi:hypothetical protein ACOME3_007545 [Neoechinorhynchus agilis]
MKPNVEPSLENEFSTDKRDLSRTAIISPTIHATDTDTLNAPLIDHAQSEKTNAAGCGKSFKLTNLGVLFAHGPRDLRCIGSGSPPQSSNMFMPGTSQITTDSISIPDIVRVLPRNVLKRIPKGT